MTAETKEKPHYGYWTEIPEGADLATKTTLGREGMKLAPGQQHVATVSYGRRGKETAYLYRRSEAIPKKPLTEKQKEGILKAQQTREENERRAYQQELAHLQAKEDARLERLEREWVEDLTEARALALQEVLTFEDRYPRDSWRILDTETTGLNGEVISLSIVDGYGNVLYDQLLRPIQDEIELEAFKIHGISMQDLEGKPTFAEVWHHVEPLLRGKTILAYNASFDRQRLYGSLRLDPSPCWPKPDLLEYTSDQWVCVMYLAADRLGGAREYKGRFDGFQWLTLDEACWQAALTLGKLPTLRPRHQASADALSTLELLNNLLEHGVRERDGLPLYSPFNWPKAAEVEAAGLGHWLESEWAWLTICRNGVAGKHPILWRPTHLLLPAFRSIHREYPDLPFETLQAWWEEAVEQARSCQPGELGECRKAVGDWELSLQWSPEDGTDGPVRASNLF